MIRARAIYRALLRCYPAAFRDEYGRQMQLAFDDQLGAARHAGGRLEQAGLWMEAARDAFTIAPKEHCHVILQDIRYTLRAMAKSPGFTAVAILSLALGIGANTAIFSLWNGVLHRSLPGVREPEQLVILTDPSWAGSWHGDSRGVREALTYEEFEQLRDRASSFSSALASQTYLDRWPVRMDGSELEEAHGRLVSGGYFETLGVSAAIGRVFTRAADGSDAAYAVISYNYWQRRFGGRADVLGRRITIRNALLTIIGVTPAGFIGETAGEQPDLWVPLRMQAAVVPGEDWLHDTPPEKIMWLHVFGRLKPGVSAARAEAESNAVFKAGLETFYGGVASAEKRGALLDQSLKIRPGGNGASEARSDFSTSLTVVLAAVGVLLLIACANLANLLLARGAARAPEMALRISLGASRGRLVRQLVTESLVLASVGGVAGLGAAWFVHSFLVGMIMQSDHDFRMTFTLDPLALAFTVAVTLAAGLLFGLLPAWQTTRGGIGNRLKQQSRGNTGGWGRTLVTLQLALSLPLLAGAGLLARTVYNLQHQQLGFPAERILLVGANSRVAGYNSARSEILFRDLLAQIRRIPGVEAASFSHNGLFSGANSNDDVEVEGFTPAEDHDRNSDFDMVGPNYFATLRIPLLLGRDIAESDDARSPRVCVINEAFAKKFFAGRNPIGMHVTPIVDGLRTTYRVAGVSTDARTGGLRGTVGPRFYIPITQPDTDNVKRANFLIRTAAGGVQVLDAVRRAYQRVDPSLPVTYARSLEEQMAPLTAPERATAQLAIGFGCVALLLAAIGLYGVLAYGIARRTREIAVRLALGAQPGGVVGMILRETAGLVAAGVVAGIGLAWAAARLIASQLFHVSPQDPASLAAAIAVLLGVALAAVYLPARRASRQDPMAALRQE